MSRQHGELALCTLSHSPLMGVNSPGAAVESEVDAALATAREFVEAFDPELVVLLGPDHYNGFFYDLMPPFCLGFEATALGDYGTASGPLPVDRLAARRLLDGAFAAGVDLAFSERMEVDHGMVQPLEVLFGGLSAVPVVPVFINSVAEPLVPVSRVRALGQAFGQAARGLDRRVLFLGSGGLSHDPPIPRIDEASPEVVERLVAGRNPSPEARALHEQKVFDAGREFAAGRASIAPLNPDWDRQFMALLAAGDFDEIGSWHNDDFVTSAGHSSHEVRTWVAAYAGLAAAGPFEVRSSFYRPIPEWIAGFGVTTATTTREQA